MLSVDDALLSIGRRASIRGPYYTMKQHVRWPPQKSLSLTENPKRYEYDITRIHKFATSLPSSYKALPRWVEQEGRVKPPGLNFRLEIVQLNDGRAVTMFNIFTNDQPFTADLLHDVSEQERNRPIQKEELHTHESCDVRLLLLHPPRTTSRKISHYLFAPPLL